MFWALDNSMKKDEAKYNSDNTIREAEAVAEKLSSSNDNADQSIIHHREAIARL